MGKTKRKTTETYMTFLEMPHTKGLITSTELKQLIQKLKELAHNRVFFATITRDHTDRWRKIEKLCYLIGMEKIVDNNPKLYGTDSIFVTHKMDEANRERITRLYSKNNLSGFLKPPQRMNLKLVKEVLSNSQRKFNELLKADDVENIYISENCGCFYVPSDIPELRGLDFVEFFTRLEIVHASKGFG
ncbi:MULTISPECIES: hypothetical protein [Cyanophyceae]|uniref:Uncharacterized protein n=1 Tax=Leptolyngbya subtilissima DQ-A4 TaxID=2933933 RepID=A0ABV0KC11_9CYAN|nr:hypothetical protein [Nodosilinea sp. FACHB-141]MBD2115254.1 hypothetical protein [Nodosilinea sp. FACHB-141]